jgi:3-phosphoshikimate 1-carboxyvinyltransferase
MRALGAEVERDLAFGRPVWRINGAKWKNPERPLYFGNSGTGCRLVIGAAAGQRISAQFDGDASLRGRPMKRVCEPLAMMGASIETREGKLPAALKAAPLQGIEYHLPVASAQIKSALLLAGLGAAGQTVIIEPTPSRDHTERMLAAFGAHVVVEPLGDGRRITLSDKARLKAMHIDVPGDPSSAAFLAAAAAIVPGSDLVIRNVLANPLRFGFFETLKEMGADINFENLREVSGEFVTDIHVRHSSLNGVEVPAKRAASMIDEYPVLAIIASYAKGATQMLGIEELRVKESDRLAAIEAGLQANGVATASGPDWLTVTGGCVRGGGMVKTHLDHRIAMSFLVMGLASKEAVSIDDASMIATSFPTFSSMMRRLGANISAR